jgi:hypothetical protein
MEDGPEPDPVVSRHSHSDVVDPEAGVGLDLNLLNGGGDIDLVREGGSRGCDSRVGDGDAVDVEAEPDHVPDV